MRYCGKDAIVLCVFRYKSYNSIENWSVVFRIDTFSYSVTKY